MPDNHLQEKNSVTDLEKDSASRDDLSVIIPGDKHGWLSHPLAKSLLSWGVEERGGFSVQPNTHLIFVHRHYSSS
jgi:hypothetical protein